MRLKELHRGEATITEPCKVSSLKKKVKKAVLDSTDHISKGFSVLKPALMIQGEGR